MKKILFSLVLTFLQALLFLAFPYGIRWDELTEEEKRAGAGLSLGK